jgi:hypothetical protein
MDKYKILRKIHYQIPSKFFQYTRTDNAITLRVHSQVSCKDHIKCENTQTLHLHKART